MIDVCKEEIEAKFLNKPTVTLRLSDALKLKPGQIVKQRIENKNGILIVREGVVLQAAMIEKLINFVNFNTLKLRLLWSRLKSQRRIRPFDGREGTLLVLFCPYTVERF